jgi:hypothetical protein
MLTLVEVVGEAALDNSGSAAKAKTARPKIIKPREL